MLEFPRRLIGAVSAAVVISSGLTGQTHPGLEFGTRVRLTFAAPSTVDSGRTTLTARFLIGDLVSADRDSVELVQAHNGEPVVMPTRWVTRLEVSRGRRSRAGRGALVGTVAGAATGAATALLLCRGVACEPSGGDLTGFLVLVFSGMGAVAGAGVGAVTGAIAKTEHWEPRTLVDLRVSMVPSRSKKSNLSASIEIHIAWPL